MSYIESLKDIRFKEDLKFKQEQEKEEHDNDIEKEDSIEYKKDFKARIWQMSLQVSKGASFEAIEKVYQEHSNRIVKLAYILHDKDKKPSGELKEAHIHVVFLTTNPCSVTTVHNWFSLKRGLIRVCKGRDSYNDILLYFTHKSYKNDIEKTHYSIDAIHQLGEQLDIENIIINKIENRNPKKRKDLAQSLKEKLLQGEITLAQIRKEHQDIFVNNIKRFQEINQQRIELLPIPNERINFYITGKGGSGKDFLTDLLSYYLTSKDEFEIDEDNERTYTAGSAKVALQEYNGQELIAFRDYRAGNLLEAFGGRGGVFGAFDTTPRKTAFNIKYGSVTLKNRYSIVNSVQTFEEFSNTLCQLSKAEIEAINQEAGYNPNLYNAQNNQDDENSEAEEKANEEKDKKRYESKLQTLRRWAFIIHILEDRILIKINNNFLYPGAKQEQYTTYAINGINLRNTIEEIKRNAITGTQEEIFKLTLESLPCLVQYIKIALEVHATNRQPNKENSILGQMISNISIVTYQEYASSELSNSIIEDSITDNVYQEREVNNGYEGRNTQCTAQEFVSIPNEKS